MTELEIASYLDRGLSEPERDRVENHLVECAACRENVTEAQQLVQDVRRPRRVFITAGFLAVAAAALVMVRPQTGNDVRSITRDAGSGPQALVAYGPVGQTAMQPVRFVWGADGNAVSYRITLTRQDGTSVWSISGTDTTAILPGGVTLRAGERYVWVTDAILSDGSTRSTGLKEFEPVK